MTTPKSSPPKPSLLNNVQSKVMPTVHRVNRNQWMVLAKAVYYNFTEDNCPQMAAAMSYFAMISIFPLLLLTITLLPNLVKFISPGFNVNNTLLIVISNNISPDASAWLATLLPELSKNQNVLNWIGLPSLILSASGVFGQLDYSFNRIWRLREDARLNSGFRAAIIGLLRGKFNSLWVLILVAFIFLVNLFISSALSSLQKRGGPSSVFPNQLLTVLLGGVVPLLLGLLSFSLLYRYMAPRPVAWRVVFPAAIIVTILNEFVRLIVAYLVDGVVGAEYQGIAGPLAIMIWVYFTSQNVLIGCELTRHYYMIFYRQTRSGGLSSNE